MSVRSTLARAAFGVGAAGAGWVLAGYPASLALRPRRDWRQGEQLPSFTIVVPAFREREALRRKLSALRDLDYPAELVQVLVAIDEDEQLVGVAREACPDAVVSFAAERNGKAAGLNRALGEATGEIVLLTDANNVLEPESLRAAARHFADPQIVAVGGRRGEAGSAYDRYEDLLRRLETRSGSVAALNGELIAVRRAALPPFPEGVINDDLWLLCQLVRAGGRVVYEPQAASEEEALDASAELARRSRMGAGRAMLLRELHGLPPAFAWRLISHKHGRLALPFLLLAALLGALGPGGGRLRRAAALVQLAFYGTAGITLATGAQPSGPAGRVARMAAQFTLGNVAVGVGVVRAARRRQSARWEPVR
ncbi:MAG: glycosyltransferase [Actinobacteria bacterium]|nr:glycosyltransferase [Actinomycetota bacterium]